MSTEIPTIQSNLAQILASKGLDGSPRSLGERIDGVTDARVRAALATPPGSYSFEKLLALVSPAASSYIEEMAQAARLLTIQRFGRAVRLYAPLYVSNCCINSCLYCGFNRDSHLRRIRLSIDQALADAEIIASEGFRDLLLVSSEDPRFITVEYLAELAGRLRPHFSSISVEIPALTTEQYAALFDAGIEGVTLYQETYDRNVYERFHPHGPKADYDWRIAATDRMALASMREIGIGALLGLSDWRMETLALGEHAAYLMRRYWQSHVSFSFPRLRPAQDVDCTRFPHMVSDRELVQMMIALRLCFADAGLVISTRESANLRDNLVRIAVTRMSAGSRTNPGGYSDSTASGEQFRIDDDRSPAEIAAMLRREGIEPVWKDWDPGFLRD